MELRPDFGPPVLDDAREDRDRGRVDGNRVVDHAGETDTAIGEPAAAGTDTRTEQKPRP